MTDEAACLVVARFMKPHGLKGEALVFSMTDEPERVFVPGGRLRPVDAEARPLAEGRELVIAHARPHQRRWLLRFEGLSDRTELEGWPPMYLGAEVSVLRPPEPDELYVHEIPGIEIVEDGHTVAVARDLMGVAGNEFLVVERDGREFLIPFRPPIVERIDRPARRIEVRLPAGLLEL